MQGQPRKQGQPGERVGPLALVRHVKDDGRALLLYAYPERESRE